ncbi:MULTISPECIES: DUF1254 domain-containing protein [unclassified Paenibacillus]|uniref:DUF1254 domain-containing protein n=1 Tax=unclassified Paenibacillus TaxID=185978 RepID=UPI0009C526AA|nr:MULTISPECIES: DUF1254 domain-containing protein [unclassified Paenibacillus]SLJ99701.1 Uncharacterized conserved protein [Paenibacillus sp. RU5A]SOC66545.1 Uncharacterized conserved protein [Paenibacillus sp. RU26A]SOC70513.1 Uncharacterized conserved protein [Paenibacillus sp. RU5M]
MRKRFRLLLYICFIVGIVSTSIAARPLEVQASPDYIKKDKAASSQEQLAYSLGVQAYIYGYPLVVMEQTRQMALKTRAPLNQFYYSSMLASPQYHDIVTPNSNTLYFSAWLDLSKGPVVLNVPANTDDRYYTVQMLDAYTNTFRNVSNRTTENKAGQFTIVGPGRSSDITKASIHAPTPIVWLLGRVEVNGEEDLKRAVAFEKQFTLSTITSKSASGIEDGSSSNPMSSMKNDPFAFYKIMTEQIRQNPPPACDAVLLDQFKLVGIDPAKGFEPADLNAATKAGLLRAAKDAQGIITNSVKSIPTTNGWYVGRDIGTYGNQFLLRAVVAYSGLGANVPEEELYARAFTDQNGEKLHGTQRYVLHFNKNDLPQVTGFWSLTLYGSDFYLVENAIGRYSIGDLTKGLLYNPDGSLDIYIQQSAPEGKESNWLPAPPGEFNLVLRMFAPKPSMLDGEYEVPPVARIQ